MAVSLHDSAYELERAIRNSEEYKTLRKLFDEVNADESAKGLFNNFRQIQLGLQQKQMMGQEITQDEVEQAQKTVALVQQNEKIANLIQAEQRMSMIVAELNQIVLKPLEDLYGPIVPKE